MKNLAKKVKELVDDKTRYTDWDVRIDVKAELEAEGIRVVTTAKKVTKEDEIEENSDMEIEIRANDLVVIDYIYKKLDGKVCRMDINDYIWLLGQDKSKINKKMRKEK